MACGRKETYSGSRHCGRQCGPVTLSARETDRVSGLRGTEGIPKVSGGEGEGGGGVCDAELGAAEGSGASTGL